VGYLGKNEIRSVKMHLDKAKDDVAILEEATGRYGCAIIFSFD